MVSDYGAVAFLQLMHRVAGTEGEAAALALAAGIDLELPSTLCYGQPLLAEIEAGRVEKALVDRALRRVLAQKLELGLLDAGWSPEPLDEGIDFDSARNRDIARRMAESSIVLLENSTGLLPLQTPQRIAIVGPCADDAQTFFGCYAFPNHVIPMYPGLRRRHRDRGRIVAERDAVGARIGRGGLRPRLRGQRWRPIGPRRRGRRGSRGGGGGLGRRGSGRVVRWRDIRRRL